MFYFLVQPRSFAPYARQNSRSDVSSPRSIRPDAEETLDAGQFRLAGSQLRLPGVPHGSATVAARALLQRASLDVRSMRAISANPHLDESPPRAGTSAAEFAQRYRRSAALNQRACTVIPGGIHLSGRALVDTASSPMYFERGQGCRLWDIDGNEYIDYLMAFGAQLLGYAHPEVERAVSRQSACGQLLSLNHPLHVEFIETLLPMFPGAEMGVYFKTGSEATSAALRVARRYTGRRRVARCGYHGWHDWCLPLEDFVPAGLEQQVPEFNANRVESLQELFAAFPGEIACVILAPEMVLPLDPIKFHQLVRIAHGHGALFIMDEVKTGLRVAPNSISERVGITPDIIALSKGLGNGWPIAAILGRREIMQVAAGIHYSATFHGETSAMAAALATIRIVSEQGVQRHVEELGKVLIDGINAVMAEFGVLGVAYPEPVDSMPFFRFTYPDANVNAAYTRRFYQEVLAGGILLHPRHMWFLSQSHTRDDIARTLEVVRSAIRRTSEAVAMAEERGTRAR